jgi:tetratricopeptide (TPR) repeat protein
MPSMNESADPQAEAHYRAARIAEEATRWQDAVAEYEACLSLAAQAGDAARYDEAEVLTALGGCYWNLAEARTAWRTLRRAITLYQERGDAVGQARATVELLRIWGPPDRHRALAEAALQALGDADPYLRARLLLRLRWFDDDASVKFDEAMSIAERHGFEDVLAARLERDAWAATDEGRVDDGIELRERAHDVYARTRAYEGAAQVLRGSGYSTVELGMLDRGYEILRQTFEYASGVNLRFAAQLALLDMVGVAFARGEFDRCEELLALGPEASDFRADLYRMWMAEARGDMEGALRLMVQPERGGNTPTAMGQIHAAAAGLLFHAGKVDAARQALAAWADVRRQYDARDYSIESPALLDCAIALADDALLRAIQESFERQDQRVRAPLRFSTLQGRATAPVRGAVALKLGLVDDAARHYRDGLAWCERERCERDAALCRAGLGRIAAR